MASVISRKALQEAILDTARQVPRLAELQLEIFPDEAEEFVSKHLKSPTGAIISSYAGRRKVQGGEHVSNKETLIDLHVVLKSKDRALETLDLLEAHLDDRRLRVDQGGVTLNLKQDQFLAETNGRWQYLQRVHCNHL